MSYDPTAGCVDCGAFTVADHGPTCTRRVLPAYPPADGGPIAVLRTEARDDEGLGDCATCTLCGDSVGLLLHRAGVTFKPYLTLGVPGDSGWTYACEACTGWLEVLLPVLGAALDQPPAPAVTVGLGCAEPTPRRPHRDAAMAAHMLATLDEDDARRDKAAYVKHLHLARAAVDDVLDHLS